MEQQNQVAKTDSKVPMNYEPQEDTETTLSGDFLFPRLLLMQGLSEFVNDDKAKQGDIVKSTTIEKVGDLDKPIQIIPLTFKNYWNEFELFQTPKGVKKEYRGKIERNAENEGLAWEYEVDGNKWKRIQTIEVFALLPGDIQAELKMKKEFDKNGAIPDIDKTVLPVVITFRSTGFKAGKALVTHFTKVKGMARKYKIPIKAHQYSLELSCYQDKNDEGTFYVWSVGKSTVLKDEEKAMSEEWYQTITSGVQTFVVDEEHTDEPKTDGGEEDF